LLNFQTIRPRSIDPPVDREDEGITRPEEVGLDEDRELEQHILVEDQRLPVTGPEIVD
jgi:hypothetical protein